MTREEAIKIIETGKNFAYDEKYVEAFDIAIKALKQEPVLDKIRAEISDRLGLLDCKKDILAIIDKYKAESEV